MFAPALGFAGRPVAARRASRGPGAGSAGAGWTLGGAGGELTADEHDRIAAATQALTHAAVLAFGLALDDLDVDVAELAAVAPPPHATLLALLARIAAGHPEVYWDVQAGQPVRGGPGRAAWRPRPRLDELVDAGDEDGFAASWTGSAPSRGARPAGRRPVPAASPCPPVITASGPRRGPDRRNQENP